MNRLKYNVNEMISDLKVKGYYLINDLTDEDIVNIRRSLFPVFPDILYVDISNFKKYFIVNKAGRNSVLKLLEGVIHDVKRVWVTNENNRQLYDHYYNEWERLDKLRKMLEKHKFYY